MAIPCEMCGMPVHEQAVVCPHCGDRTGVPADPDAARRIAQLPALPAADATPPVAGLIEPIVDAIGAAVDSALDLFQGERDAKLPRAIARESPTQSRPGAARPGRSRSARGRRGGRAP